MPEENNRYQLGMRKKMKKLSIVSAIVMIVLTILALPVYSKVELDIETGGVFSGYNDVRIPGNEGTLFSLSKELETNPLIFYRIRLFYDFNARHHVGVLFAPLVINSTGQLDRDIIFVDKTFPANTPLETTYQFNSYRLIYRYDFLRKEKIELGMGLTAKIRDAKIAVKGNGIEAEKTNVGFVPIVHFRLLWKMCPTFAFLLDGDALAAPQGRAEDIFAGMKMKISDRFDLKLGYRIIEGGADGKEVYTFTLLNYASIGAVVHF
jgi:hypothetical protein